MSMASTNIELLKASGRAVAFVGEGTEVEVNRLVDDDLLPPGFFYKAAERREYDLLGTAAALRFNRKWKDMLTKQARKDFMVKLEADHLHSFTVILNACESNQRPIVVDNLIRQTTWVVEVKDLSFDLTHEMNKIGERIRLLYAAEGSIVSDPEIMGGKPVFKGTRLPIETVLASIDAGVPVAEIIDDYPALTEASIDQARLYARLHPRAGRPRKASSKDNRAVMRSVDPPGKPGLK
ncbi:Uncharacterized conserved protein, DUF433 family [Pseudomonas delhiensis]|uniref:Uncharacterized conserved protein, DUF433 family n=2 Tax=Pseudomonas delhiensis TaxID=366289 RepID=A0A239KFF9_9PSED|nr:Uncharacterized conserved protein, DUF433 family [Pseudomonas delhiensis]SNT16418.1 Uncharacterized conserved protein, DUF433 family [Pseudomonas delhiensis]